MISILQADGILNVMKNKKCFHTATVVCVAVTFFTGATVVATMVAIAV